MSCDKTSDKRYRITLTENQLALVGTAVEGMMSDLISRQAAIDAYGDWYVEEGTEEGFIGTVKQLLEGLPSAEPEIIRCKDCKFYSPMNRETKTGICNLTMHQNFGDNWFCAGAERRTDE